MRRVLILPFVCSCLAAVLNAQTPAQPAAQTAPPVSAIRAGRLLDPDAGVVRANQIILVEGTRIRDVGPNVAIPAGAQVIDLSKLTVLPGFVDAHNHLALTYKPEPENNVYYYTYVQESTALRAIQAASNGIQMLSSGFTIVRDMGHDVTGVAVTRDEAVALAMEERPGLVLADIQLADDSSGIDAVKDILAEFSVPVIFITAFPERLLTGERPEPTFLITKPFQRETVKTTIAQALFFDQATVPAIG